MTLIPNKHQVLIVKQTVAAAIQRIYLQNLKIVSIQRTKLPKKNMISHLILKLI